MCVTSTTADPRRGVLQADLPTVLASRIPSHPICAQAYTISQSVLPASIFNHCFRVYLLAEAIAESEAVPVNKPVLFVACILHDVGASDTYNGPKRFEVEAGDVAAALIRQYSDLSHADAQDAWQGIALHTSAGIAEYMTSFTRLVRLAVLVDFFKRTGPALAAELADAVAKVLPREDVEKDLGDAVAAQGEGQPSKAPAASWPGDLVRAKRENPEWTGVNKGF